MSSPPRIARDTAPPYIKRLMRVGWHITTLFWFAIAAHLIAMDLYPGQERQSYLIIMPVAFGISCLVALINSKGKHLSWIGFGAATAFLSTALRS